MESYCKTIFFTEEKSWLVHRDCDNVYERLLGFDTFDMTKDGCRDFKTDVQGVERKGKYCVCSTENCNDGLVE